MSTTKRKPYSQVDGKAAVELKPLTDLDTSALDEKDKTKSQEWMEYAVRKLTALLWIIVAGALAIYIKLYDVIIASYTPGNTGKQLAVFWFNVGLAGFAGWCLLALYLVVWLKYIQRIDIEWEEYSPKAIPIATVCALSSLLGCASAPRTRRPRTCAPTLLAPTTHPPRTHLAASPHPRTPRGAQVHRRLLAGVGLLHAAHHLVPLPWRDQPRPLLAAVARPAKPVRKCSVRHAHA